MADAAFNGAVDAAVLFQEHAKAAGIDINVIREPNDGYWDNVWLKKPWCASYWSGRPTVDWMMTTAYAAGAAWNETYWNNPRFNELLVAARGELDETKRATHVCRDAAARPRRRRRHRPGLQQHRRGPFEEARRTARSHRTGKPTA